MIPRLLVTHHTARLASHHWALWWYDRQLGIIHLCYKNHYHHQHHRHCVVITCSFSFQLNTPGSAMYTMATDRFTRMAYTFTKPRNPKQGFQSWPSSRLVRNILTRDKKMYSPVLTQENKQMACPESRKFGLLLYFSFWIHIWIFYLSFFLCNQQCPYNPHDVS